MKPSWSERAQHWLEKHCPDTLFHFFVQATESGGSDANSMMFYLEEIIIEDCKRRDCPPTPGTVSLTLDNHLAILADQHASHKAVSLIERMIENSIALVTAHSHSSHNNNPGSLL